MEFLPTRATLHLRCVSCGETTSMDVVEGEIHTERVVVAKSVEQELKDAVSGIPEGMEHGSALEQIVANYTFQVDGVRACGCHLDQVIP